MHELNRSISACGLAPSLCPVFDHRMEHSLFVPTGQVLNTCANGECVSATLKGPSKRGDDLAVIEY